MTTLNRANEVRSNEPIRHGAYLCLRGAGVELARRGPQVRALADRLGLRNEFDPGADHPPEAIAFLRRVAATPGPGPRPGPGPGPGAIADDELERAELVVHVASAAPEPVAELIAELTRLVGPELSPRVLGGVVRPMSYTGQAMYNFAYAERVLQQPGGAAPHAFLLPMSKTAAWWQKDWMERHTYLLPRHDDAGRRVSRGHALASAAGVSSLMRRTYKSPVEPAPAGAYDFLTYFECADDGVATFHAVCAALRDVADNPEWAFVREGPLWHGRRVATWEELFA
jgi:hypothetical protein